MKPCIRCRSPRGLWRSGELAFTLPELMVSIAIFLILVGGMVATNMFGLRMFQIEQAKLSASDGARKIVGGLVDEIRSCDSFQIGTVSTNGTFTALSLGATQAGPALIVFPIPNNTTNFIVYYVNSNDQKFRRVTNAKGSTRVLAASVTNTTELFRAQDYAGNVVTNIQNNTVLHAKLEFYQAPRFGVLPDYYKLETSATRR
jgi:prepilin-type N-terminal cleavage/methylation domain-containing protein